jgi:glycosyltransferase A (GT-A) superfamily protein (DUF2064 family)
VQTASRRLLLLFTKPALPGRVKTRLIGDLTAAQAADLHAAFLGDVLDRLQGGRFEMRIAWALEPGEEVPVGPVRGEKQEGVGLGERLYGALSGAAREVGERGAVMALGSDHPTVPLELVHRAFERVEAGAEVVLGPAEDGGYYLIAVAAGAVRGDRLEHRDGAGRDPGPVPGAGDRAGAAALGDGRGYTGGFEKAGGAVGGGGSGVSADAGAAHRLGVGAARGGRRRSLSG